MTLRARSHLACAVLDSRKAAVVHMATATWLWKSRKRFQKAGWLPQPEERPLLLQNAAASGCCHTGKLWFDRRAHGENVSAVLVFEIGRRSTRPGLDGHCDVPLLSQAAAALSLGVVVVWLWNFLDRGAPVHSAVGEFALLEIHARGFSQYARSDLQDCVGLNHFIARVKFARDTLMPTGESSQMRYANAVKTWIGAELLIKYTSDQIPWHAWCVRWKITTGGQTHDHRLLSAAQIRCDRQGVSCTAFDGRMKRCWWHLMLNVTGL